MKLYSFLRESEEDKVLLSLYVQPGASKSEWSGLHGEHLKLRITAPPVDGQANKLVASFLAKEFGVSKSQVQLLKGETNRHKTFLLSNISLIEVYNRLQPYLP